MRHRLKAPVPQGTAWQQASTSACSMHSTTREEKVTAGTNCMGASLHPPRQSVVLQGSVQLPRLQRANAPSEPGAPPGLLVPRHKQWAAQEPIQVSRVSRIAQAGLNPLVRRADRIQAVLSCICYHGCKSNAQTRAPHQYTFSKNGSGAAAPLKWAAKTSKQNVT